MKRKPRNAERQGIIRLCPEHGDQRPLDVWPDQFTDEIDGYIDVPIPAAVVDTRGFVIGRFNNAADAVFAMNHWPSAFAVICGGRMIASRDDRLNWLSRNAA